MADVGDETTSTVCIRYTLEPPIRITQYVTRDAPVWYQPIGYQFIGKYSLISILVVLLLI